MNTGFLTIASLVLAQGIAAQTPAPAGDSAIRWSALKQRPRLLDTTRTASVRYPDMLRSSSVGGVLDFEATIDTSGFIRLTRVVSSTHDMFTNAAKAAVPHWRFTPTSIGGRRVAINVPVRVEFLFPRSGIPWVDTTSVESDSAGIHIVLGAAEISQTPGVRFTREDSISARVALMIAAAETPAFGEKKSPIICFRWGVPGQNVPKDVFKIIKSRLPEVLNVDECPRTYTTMFMRIDSAGNPDRGPPGHVDPTWIDISRLRLWTKDVAIGELETSHGTGGTKFFCQARRTSNDEWVAMCKPLSVWVSMS